MMQLNQEHYQLQNIFTLEKLAEKIPQLKEEGKTIGLCTGSFDLLHPGHITHLTSAKKFCDVLVVGVANDAFGSRKSETGRPVFPEYARAYMVGQLKAVDFVFLEDGTPKHLELLKPNYFIKGPDYSTSTAEIMVQQRKMLEGWGGQLVYTADEKLSTTELIDYIQNSIR